MAYVTSSAGAKDNQTGRPFAEALSPAWPDAGEIMAMAAAIPATKRREVLLEILGSFSCARTDA